MRAVSVPGDDVSTVVTQDWQNVRIWVGKTGKDGLKRRCLDYLKSPEKVVIKDGVRTRELLESLDLDDVRDVSAGAATFYVWVS